MTVDLDLEPYIKSIKVYSEMEMRATLARYFAAEAFFRVIQQLGLTKSSGGLALF